MWEIYLTLSITKEEDSEANKNRNIYDEGIFITLSAKPPQKNDDNIEYNKENYGFYGSKKDF